MSHTPGPWHLCQHLKGIKEDSACSCGYRGVIYGPEHNVPMAICQPGHDAEPVGQEGLGPVRYPREVEIANARLIAAAPDLLDALRKARTAIATWSPDPREPLEEIDAAIIKATGGQS